MFYIPDKKLEITEKKTGEKIEAVVKLFYGASSEIALYMERAGAKGFTPAATDANPHHKYYDVLNYINNEDDPNLLGKMTLQDFADLEITRMDSYCARGSHVGTELIRSAIAFSIATGHEGVLKVEAALDAIAFYKKCGFVADTETPCYDDTCVPMILTKEAALKSG